MSTHRYRHRQWTQAVRSDPDYCAHQNELRRIRYGRRTVTTTLQRELLSGDVVWIQLIAKNKAKNVDTS